MVTVLVESRTVPPFAMSAYDLVLALPCSARTARMAAVSVVLPWSMCPMVPTLTCGLVLVKVSFAMCSALLCLTCCAQRLSASLTTPAGIVPSYPTRLLCLALLDASRHHRGSSRSLPNGRCRRSGAGVADPDAHRPRGGS